MLKINNQQAIEIIQIICQLNKDIYLVDNSQMIS